VPQYNWLGGRTAIHLLHAEIAWRPVMQLLIQFDRDAENQLRMN
jgi:hypothetical protein